MLDGGVKDHHGYDQYGRWKSEPRVGYWDKEPSFTKLSGRENSPMHESVSGLLQVSFLRMTVAQSYQLRKEGEGKENQLFEWSGRILGLKRS